MRRPPPLCGEALCAPRVRWDPTGSISTPPPWWRVAPGTRPPCINARVCARVMQMQNGIRVFCSPGSEPAPWAFRPRTGMGPNEFAERGCRWEIAPRCPPRHQPSARSPRSRRCGGPWRADHLQDEDVPRSSLRVRWRGSQHRMAKFPYRVRYDVTTVAHRCTRWLGASSPSPRVRALR